MNESGNTFIVTATANNSPAPRVGTLTISLTDLKEGSYSVSMDVIQLTLGGAFLRQDFGTDSDYDNSGNSSATLTITYFGTDNNWNIQGNNSLTISVSGYNSDANYDVNTKSSGTIIKTDYDNDENWDSNKSSGLTISVSGYNADNNWN